MKRTLLSVCKLAGELGISADSVYRAYRREKFPGPNRSHHPFDLGQVCRAMEESTKALPTVSSWQQMVRQEIFFNESDFWTSILGERPHDVEGANRLVLRRALRLDGYKAVLDFDASNKADIKAKYSNKLVGAATVGEVGGEMSAAWTNDEKLELTATDGVYVAGEFAELVKGEWVSARGEDSIPNLGDKYIAAPPCEIHIPLIR